MIKAEMIQKIKTKEAYAWMMLHTYDQKNAPDDGDYDTEIHWEMHDQRHIELLEVWNALHELMEELGLKPDFNDEYHNQAQEASHELFLRRQANRGIVY